MSVLAAGGVLARVWQVDPFVKAFAFAVHLKIGRSLLAVGC